MKFSRTLTSAGVHFQYLRFSHGQRVFDVLDGVGKTKIKVIITVDPSNLKSVIIDTPEGRRVQLPCLAPELIEGLSLWEHQNLVKYMRCCNYDLADRERWLIAKKEIRDTLMASLLNRKNKVSTNSTIARRLNIGGKGNVGLVALNRVVDTEADWLKLDFVNAEDTDPDALYKNSHEGRLPDSNADELQPIVDEPTKTMNGFGRHPPKLPRKKKVATPTDDIVRHDTSSVSQAEQPDDDIDLLLSKYSAPHLSRT
ncbi:hypothetical protein [Microvirga ossetica]|nr:hypothetical protein [Microvirga ossetica]